MRISRSRAVSDASEGGGRFVAAGEAAGEALEQAARHGRGEHRLAGGDHAHALDQLRSGDVLEQEAARAGAQRLVDVLVDVERREDEHAALDAAQHNPPGRLDPVHAGHADVHQHDVREQPLGQLDGLGSVTGLGDDLDLLAGR